jgi:cbb3-type cytochrome oxidase subunit 3
MNHVIHEAASTATAGWLVGAATVLFMALFVGTFAWLWSRRARPGLEEAARLPLEDETED